MASPPMRFDWNFDSNSSDFTSFFSIDLNPASGSGNLNPSASTSSGSAPAPGSLLDSASDLSLGLDLGLDPGAEGNNLQLPHSASELLDPDDEGTGAEFYMNPQISENSLPNDDMWKKFGIFDTDDNRELNVERADNFDDLNSMQWMNPMYSQTMTNDAREIRNHDCMWAGHCISEKHERNNQKNLKSTSLLQIKKPQVPKSEEPDLLVLSTSDGPAFAENRMFGQRSAVVAPTHERSLLLPSRIVSATVTSGKPSAPKSHTVTTSLRVNRSRTLDSGGDSPRPETPQSLSDHEDLSLDMPDIGSVEDLAIDNFDYSFITDMVQNIESEESNSTGSDDDFVASQFGRSQQAGGSNVSSSATNSVGNRVKKTDKQEVPVSRHYTSNSFFSDHCYHLSKNTRMDNLGVQTPSDSEEEIDVETVCGDVRKPNSRSSSSGSVLPTNPSLSDRQQLQLTMATAINKKDTKKPGARAASSSIPSCETEDGTTRDNVSQGGRRRNNARNDEQRSGCNKRGAQFDDLNELLNNSVKKKRGQNQNNSRIDKTKTKRNGKSSGRSSGTGSSDSEVDSIERRTIHNSMERQRRIDLRNSFEELRKLIPNTAENEKAPKVLILSSGADYCRALAIQDHELNRKRAELRRQQQMLLARVSHLRRALAARR